MNWKNIVEENNLDISVINFSDIERFRIDSDFYSQRFLKNENDIKKIKSYSIGDTCIVKSGTTPKDRDDELKNGIILLKTTDIRDIPLFLDSNYYRISEKINERMLSTQLQEGDVLINIVGATLGVIGRTSIVPKKFSKANITQAMALIRPKSKDFLPEYIFAFLLSKCGNLQAQRLARPTGQYNLNLQEISAIKIATANLDFQKLISNIVSQSEELNNKSIFIYKEAESYFLKEINLYEYKVNTKNISIRKIKDCLLTDRFDAEYWQEKYDEIDSKVSDIPKKELGEIVATKKGFEPGSESYCEEGKLFVRVSDFSIYGIDEGEKKISEELYEKLKTNYKPNKDEILFTKDGTIGISFALHENIDVIVSGAFLRLIPKIKINNDYLALVLNSFYCKTQIERMSGGAIIAHLKPDIAMKIKIPMLTEVKQEEIGEKILSSLKLRKEAKELLEKAKKAIEIFVEEGEKKALDFINS